MKGNGFDFVLNSQNLTHAFKWQSTLNLSYAKMIITKYYNGGYRASDRVTRM